MAPSTAACPWRRSRASSACGRSGSAPLILGSDLTSAVTNAYGTSSGLDPTDFRMLTNGNMIAIDQDAIDASRIYDTGERANFAKTERSGDGIVGLFDTSTNLATANDTISTTPSAIGVSNSSHGYLLQNVWTGETTLLGQRPRSPSACLRKASPCTGSSRWPFELGVQGEPPLRQLGPRSA